MKIAVSSSGASLDAASSPVFGRCPTFVFVDTDTLEFEAKPNPAMDQGGGAGIQAAQFVVNEGAQAVLTGNLGPNAFDVLHAAGVPGFLFPEGTVRQAVEGYTTGKLTPMGGASAPAHAGMGGGTRAASAQRDADAARKAELAELRETLKGLRQQLAETMETIEKLGKEN